MNLHLKQKIKNSVKKIIPEWLKSIFKSGMRAFKRIALKAIYRKYSQFTMIPEAVFCDNLELVESFSGVKGSVVECGVWRGGMIAAIAEQLGQKRMYYLFDSFEGLPKAKDIDGQAAQEWQSDVHSSLYFDNCSAEIQCAEEAMQQSGTTQYEIIKGWFEKTLPVFAPAEPIAILRIDSDWYDSTMQCLENLYERVAAGGLIIIDDYYTWEGCTKAVHDYLSAKKFAAKIRQSSNGVCYIIKE